MYDTDEEIKRKRRTLFIIIGIIVFLILLLLIFLFTRNSGKKKDDGGNVSTEITCTLEVQNGITPDNNGVYHQPVTVGFKNITAISKDYQITKQAIGTSDNSRNKETFTATKAGKYHLYGYVQDNVGHKGKCELNLTITLSNPTCELEVTKGTLGDNGWYRSNVVVGFSSMDANNTALSIVKYYIEKEMTSLDSSEVVKAEQPKDNIDKYTVKDNQETTLVGHVIDSAGNEGTCKLTVKKDSTVPKCTLKVLSGTKNGNGEYTDNPVIGLAETKDDVSEIASKGVGVSKNYKQSQYTVSAEGKTTVVGYVKDKAGNEGTCSIEIARPSSSGGNSGGNGGGNSGGNTSKTSKPTCKISLTVPSTDQSGKYSQNVTAKLSYSTTNGATISSYGIAESETYNQRNEITITNNGKHTVYGIVKDSYGHVAKCSTPSFVIDKGDLLYTKVKVGDYVDYDAGNWSETRTEQKIDGYYWGMKSGTSKQTGVKCNKNDTGTRSGWMVYNVVGQEVYLIHAGTPECIYHGRTSTANVISTMQSEAQKYVNSKYAHGSTIVNCNLSGFNCNANSFPDTLYTTGTHYWIAQPGDNYTLYSISPKGSKQPFSLISQGLRPIVILNTDVKTTGKNSSGAWVLK